MYLPIHLIIFPLLFIQASTKYVLFVPIVQQRTLSWIFLSSIKFFNNAFYVLHRQNLNVYEFSKLYLSFTSSNLPLADSIVIPDVSSSSFLSCEKRILIFPFSSLSLKSLSVSSLNYLVNLSHSLFTDHHIYVVANCPTLSDSNLSSHASLVDVPIHSIPSLVSSSTLVISVDSFAPHLFFSFSLSWFLFSTGHPRISYCTR